MGIAPEYSRARVDAAGDSLIRIGTPFSYDEADELEEALTIINNWRFSHRVPLNAIQVTLRQRAKTVDEHAIVPQRLKRLPAIEAKLRLHEGMKLSRMHDIGGCRAIVKDVQAVRAVVRKCEIATVKSPHRRARLVRKYDYMDGSDPGPKADGYRGVHIVYQYRSDRSALTVYNGLRIEVQIRSRLQHAFATAVETASIFTEQPIKAIKANLRDERWRRFFAVMGGALAQREKTTMVPGVPEDSIRLVAELRELARGLNVETVLSGWGETVERLSGHTKDAKAFLVLLDADAKTTEVIGYAQKDTPKTDEEYLEIEKKFRGKPSQQVVWVRAESIDGLRIAYPNFYLDTKVFIKVMKEAME
jgi:ppGpp synthetase/RelA/SpoT-type nucleotidyltranferase